MEFRPDQSRAISSLFEDDCKELMRNFNIAFPPNREVPIGETASVIYYVPNGPNICLMAAYRRPVDQRGNTAAEIKPVRYNMGDGLTKEALDELAEKKGVVGAVGDLPKRVVMWFDILRTDPLTGEINKVGAMPEAARRVWDELDNKYPDRFDIPSREEGLEMMPDARDSNLPPEKRA